MDSNYYIKMSMLCVNCLFFFKLVHYRSSEITLQQKDIEREWLENNNEIM
jgi:ribosomal protein S26